MVSKSVGCSQPWLRQVGLDAAKPFAFLRHICISVRRGGDADQQGGHGNQHRQGDGAAERVLTGESRGG